MQWIPKQIVGIGEDFHSQVGDGKIRTTLYKVRWEGFDKKDDTWETITYLQGYVTMVKSFKESHVTDLEKLTHRSLLVWVSARARSCQPNVPGCR
jgi:hypothetical protein